MSKSRKVSRRKVLAGAAGVLGSAVLASKSAAQTTAASDPTKVQGHLASEIGQRSAHEQLQRIPFRSTRTSSHTPLQDLERNGYDEAAGSLREGMEETLTVVKLALPESLRKSLATTNSIENLNGTIRRVSRNVKRWKSPSMIRRWTALGVVTAEKKFRRIKGYRHMGALVQALRSKQKSLDSDAFAA